MKAEVLRSVNDVDGLEDAGNHLPISSVKVEVPAFVVHLSCSYIHFQMTSILIVMGFVER